MQPRHPLVGKGMNKVCHIHTMEYYPAIERNELSSGEKTWSNFKCILLGERSQTGKATSWVIPAIGRCRNGKTTETVERSVAAKGLVAESEE